MIDGPEVWPPPRLTLALTMALHELATNAVKYGALSWDGGRVALSWEVAVRSGPALLRLTSDESGGPSVTPPTRSGFGSKPIARARASEMGGKAGIDYRPAGVRFALEAPLPGRLAVMPEVEFAIERSA